jgi:hypothetical protein
VIPSVVKFAFRCGRRLVGGRSGSATTYWTKCEVQRKAWELLDKTESEGDHRARLSRCACALHYVP